MINGATLTEILVRHLPLALASLTESYCSTSSVVQWKRGRMEIGGNPDNVIGRVCNLNYCLCFRVIDHEAHVLCQTRNTFQFVYSDLKTKTQRVLYEFPGKIVQSVYDVQGRDEFLLVTETSLPASRPTLR